MDKYFMYFNFLIYGLDVLSHLLFYFPTSEMLKVCIIFLKEDKVPGF